MKEFKATFKFMLCLLRHLLVPDAGCFSGLEIVKKSSRQTTLKTSNYRQFQINNQVPHAFIKGNPFKKAGKVVVIKKRIEEIGFSCFYQLKITKNRFKVLKK